jgi:uncharacterized protein YgiM (DUF1202 family)
MRQRPLPALLLCALLLGPASCSAANAPDEFEAGMQALTAGDYAEAYCRWKPLAEGGHAEAQYHLGWLYANGNGLSVDIGRALDWWMKAAGQGHADAQFAVGLAYTTGEGIKADLDEAVDWYLAAARRGHQDARDILIRLNGDPAVKLLERHPELAGEPWFGWRAVITGERINVRGGPGTEHTVVAQLDKGQQVRVIGQRGDWYMVTLDPAGEAQPAWIFKALLSGIDG